jgi:hypothetical protein
MAGYQELIAPVKPSQQDKRWNQVELAARTSIAVRARQDEVPDAVETAAESRLLQGVWKEMIHIGGRGAAELNPVETVEAVTLLISAQGITRSCDRSACPASVQHEKMVRCPIVMDRDERRRQPELPSGLNKAPPRLRLIRQIRDLFAFEQFGKCVGNTNSIVAAPKILVEALLDRFAADHMERIDDVVEAESDRRLDQACTVEFACVCLATGVEKPAPLERPLLVGQLEVFAEVIRERCRQFAEGDDLTRFRTRIQ